MPMMASSRCRRLRLASPARRRSSGPSSLPPLQDWSAALLSMALGEYVSVSSQRDSERALIAKEKAELATMPREELAELTQLYQDKGLSPQTARQVAEELTANDALAAHLDAELNIDQEDIVSPWRAAYASAVAFLIGGLLPILAIIVFPDSMRIPATFAAVLLALAITGATGAYLGGSPMLRPDSSGGDRRRDRTRGDVPHRSSAGHHGSGLEVPLGDGHQASDTRGVPPSPIQPECQFRLDVLRPSRLVRQVRDPHGRSQCTYGLDGRDRADRVRRLAGIPGGSSPPAAVASHASVAPTKRSCRRPRPGPTPDLRGRRPEDR